MARTTPHDLFAAGSPAGPQPLYRRIAAELLGELHDGTIPPGERLPGERRLAEHFGVSRETVRQALEVLRRDGLVATDRRGSHAGLPACRHRARRACRSRSGRGRRTRGPRSGPPSHGRRRRPSTPPPSVLRRAGRRWCTATSPSPRTGGAPHGRHLVLGRRPRRGRELARYRDRADGTGSAQLRRVYDWMRRAGLTLHHRDTISRLPDTPSVRVTRRVEDQHARLLEITDLLVDTQREALVYEFTLPATG